MFVADVLICTSAARAKIGTFRLHPVGRRILNLRHLRFGELFFLADNLSRNQFTIYGVRNEDGLPLLASDSFSAESDVFDFQFNNAHLSNWIGLTSCSENPAATRLKQRP